jgi:hypothetical protein
MRSTWTDSRLDDFKSGVDLRLDDLNGRVTDLSTRVTEMDGRLTSRIDNLQHTMVHGFIAIMVAMFTGFLGLAAAIVTKL